MFELPGKIHISCIQLKKEQKKYIYIINVLIYFHYEVTWPLIGSFALFIIQVSRNKLLLLDPASSRPPGRTVAIFIPRDSCVFDSDTCCCSRRWISYRKSAYCSRVLASREQQQARLPQSRDTRPPQPGLSRPESIFRLRATRRKLSDRFGNPNVRGWDNGWKTGAIGYLSERLHDGLPDPYNVTHLGAVKYEGSPWNFTNLHSLDMTLGVRKNGQRAQIRKRMWFEDIVVVRFGNVAWRLRYLSRYMPGRFRCNNTIHVPVAYGFFYTWPFHCTKLWELSEKFIRLRWKDSKLRRKSMYLKARNMSRPDISSFSVPIQSFSNFLRGCFWE